MALTSEEQRELDELELQELEAQEQESAPELAEPVQEPVEEEESLGAGAAFAVSAGQELALGHGDEFLAGVQTAAETLVGDKKFSEIQETYSKNVQDYRDTEAKLKKLHPDAYDAGTVAGIVGSIATGGILAKGAAKGLTKIGLGSLSKAAGSAGIMAKAGTAGAINSIGYSENLDAQAANDAVVSGIFGAVAGKGITVAGGAIKNMAGRISKNLLGVNSASGRKALDAHLKTRGNEPVDKWLKEVIDDGVFGAGDNLDGAILKTKDLIAKSSKDIDKVISTLPEDKIINTADLQWRLQSEVVDPLLGNGTEDGIKLGTRLSEYINSLGVEGKRMSGKNGVEVEIAPEISLQRLYGIKKTIADTITKWDKTADQSFKGHLKGVVGKLMGIVDEGVAFVEGTGKVDPGSAALFKKARSKMHNYLFLEKHMTKEASKRANASSYSFQEAIRLAMLGAGASAAGVTGGAVIPVAYAIKEVAKMQGVQTSFAKGMMKLGDAVASGNGVVAARLSVAANKSIEDFKTQAAGEMSKLTLRFEPLERSVEAAFSRKGDILTMLRSDSPALGSQLSRAFEANDEVSIAQIMDQASNNEELKKYFRKGSGIDGKVYSQEDKTFFENEISNSDMSAVQKRKLKLDLRKNGTIPQGQQDGRHTQKQTQKVDKTRPLI